MQQQGRSRAPEPSEIEAETIGRRGEQSGALGGKQEKPSCRERDGLNFLEECFRRIVLRADEADPVLFERLILQVSTELSE